LFILKQWRKPITGKENETEKYFTAPLHFKLKR